MTLAQAMRDLALVLLDAAAASACFLAALALFMLLAIDVLDSAPFILTICGGLMIAAFRLVSKAGM